MRVCMVCVEERRDCIPQENEFGGIAPLYICVNLYLIEARRERIRMPARDSRTNFISGEFEPEVELGSRD